MNKNSAQVVKGHSRAAGRALHRPGNCQGSSAGCFERGAGGLRQPTGGAAGRRTGAADAGVD